MSGLPSHKLPCAFYGPIIHSVSPQQLEILEHGLLIVDKTGIIVLCKELADSNEVNSSIAEGGFQRSELTFYDLPRGQFLIPGFIDTHNHAPQWTQRGTGRDKPLMDWLNDITFPHEAKFADPRYAEVTYSSCVEGFLRQGITTASYYGSLHEEATGILADVCLRKGQRALVGKCNMTQNSPDFYCEASAEESLQATERFIAHVEKADPSGALVRPILTPRFAISCDRETLSGLGQLVVKYPHLPIQTHFVETMQEVAVTKELFSEFSSEADLYEHYGLMNERTIMAHCIFVGEHEVARLKARESGVAHCPISTATGGEFGVAPIRRYFQEGIKVGLGTDSGGGYSSSMLDAMRQAFIISKARQLLTGGKDQPLTIPECFWLATMGGAEVCGLDGKVGNFVVGKELDGLVISTVDPSHSGVVAPIEDDDPLELIFEKFLATGDDRNIARVFVKGRQVVPDNE